MSWVLGAEPVLSFLMKPTSLLMCFEEGNIHATITESLTLEWDEVEIVMWERPASFTLRRKEPK